VSERVLVIGLDSAPLTWVEKWVNEGRLPNLKRLMANGATGILRTVNPPLSPAAWSSFATGLYPGNHGVFDHIYRRPGTYDLGPTNSSIRKGVPVWQIISQDGGRVGVINVPETYPPTPLNGFMLSGMDTPSDEADFAYPPELKQELQQAVGGYQVFGLRSKENLDQSIQGMHQTIPMRVRAGQYLWETYQPDFMILVFMETDVIQHKCWKYMDPQHPEFNRPENQQMREQYKETIPDIYQRVDTALGPWLETLDENTTVIVMSDHGAGPLNKFLHLNNWLVREGFMHFKASALARLKYAAFRLGFTPSNAVDLAAKLRLGIVDNTTNRIKREMGSKQRTTAIQQLFLSWTDVDWSRTRAYALGGNFTGFYVNLKGREPQGCVAPGPEYESLRDEIASRLQNWLDPDTGNPIVDQAFRREELHSGPFIERAPDVIFTTTAEAYTGFGGHEFGSNLLMQSSAMFNGHHRMDGMISISGPGVVGGKLETSHIVDLAPTILYRLGYPVPVSMDGKVIQQAFTADYLAAHPIQSGPPVNVSTDENEDGGRFNQTEEDKVMNRLKDLGYL